MPFESHLSCFFWSRQDTSPNMTPSWPTWPMCRRSFCGPLIIPACSRCPGRKDFLSDSETKNKFPSFICLKIILSDWLMIHKNIYPSQLSGLTFKLILYHHHDDHHHEHHHHNHHHYHHSYWSQTITSCSKKLLNWPQYKEQLKYGCPKI